MQNNDVGSAKEVAGYQMVLQGLLDIGDGLLYFSSKRDLCSSCIGPEKDADRSNFDDRSLA